MQPTLFDQATHESHPLHLERDGVRRNASEVTNAAISRAVTHANYECSDPSCPCTLWSYKAYEFLCHYVSTHDGTFMTEEVRRASEGIVPEPPSKRAWGGIIRKAVMHKLITLVTIAKVSNLKAHQANAAVWRKL